MELILYLDNAEGEVWLSDVEITTASPGKLGFSPTDWNAFETADGVHYVGIMDCLTQPEYAPKAEGGYCSPLIMDTVHKLLRAAGFNHIREFVYWNDINVHYPSYQHQTIIWNSDPDNGSFIRAHRISDCIFR